VILVDKTRPCNALKGTAHYVQTLIFVASAQKHDSGGNIFTIFNTAQNKNNLLCPNNKWMSSYNSFNSHMHWHPHIRETIPNCPTTWRSQ